MNTDSSDPVGQTSGHGFELKVLSWNLAMFERSADSPTYWGHSDVEATVRQIVLDLKPDVVVLQELPGLVPFVETHDMVRSNPRTHNGNLATLVTHQLMASAAPTPSVVKRAAIVSTFAPLDLTIANVHLPPGRGGGQERHQRLREIVETSTTGRVLVIGDTNTRLAEEPSIRKLGLTGERPPKPTWDGHRNRFRGDSGKFRAYFTRAFTQGPLEITSQRVLDDQPIEIDGSRFYVSDHFALLITIAG